MLTDNVPATDNKNTSEKSPVILNKYIDFHTASTDLTISNGQGCIVYPRLGVTMQGLLNGVNAPPPSKLPTVGIGRQSTQRLLPSLMLPNFAFQHLDWRHHDH